MYFHRDALSLVALQLANTAFGYVVPPTSPVPIPKLHYSKAQQFQAGSEQIKNVTQNSAQAYSLVTSYTSSNWFNQFSVQAVSVACSIELLQLLDVRRNAEQTWLDFRPYSWLRQLRQPTASSISRPVQDYRQPGVHWCRQHLRPEPKRHWTKQRAPDEQHRL